MNLLGNKLERLQSKSKGILSVFQTTLGKLSQVNQEIIIEQAAVAEKIQDLEITMGALDRQLADNEKMANKLQDFLN